MLRPHFACTSRAHSGCVPSAPTSYSRRSPLGWLRTHSRGRWRCLCRFARLLRMHARICRSEISNCPICLHCCLRACKLQQIIFRARAGASWSTWNLHRIESVGFWSIWRTQLSSSAHIRNVTLKVVGNRAWGFERLVCDNTHTSAVLFAKSLSSNC